MTTRELWPGGPATSAIGLGTWALGGPTAAGGRPVGWGGDWDPTRAAEVLRAAFVAGITLFDTADSYGCGAAERLIGDTLVAHRDEIVLVSKWGNLIREDTRHIVGFDPSPGYVRPALEASLRRLRTDHLDLYLLHLSGLPTDQANELLPTLQDLVAEGKIRAYGWSTDEPELAAAWVGQPGFAAIEFEENVVRDAPALVGVCEEHALGGLCRGPLGTGLLGGRYAAESQIADIDDFRCVSPEWQNYFQGGRPVPEYLDRLDRVRDILTDKGRTLAQGALAWLLARSPNLVPIPGAQRVEQVRENAGVLTIGPLDADEMAAVALALEHD